MRSVVKSEPPDGGWPNILTFEEGRRYARLSEHKFRELLRSGAIHFRRVGRTILIPRAEIDAWAGAASVEQEFLEA